MVISSSLSSGSLLLILLKYSKEGVLTVFNFITKQTSYKQIGISVGTSFRKEEVP